MHIVVSCAMDEQELAIPQVVHELGEIALLVALVVVRHIGEAQIPLGIGGVWKYIELCFLNIYR